VLTLAIDTATAQVGVAVGRDGRVVGEVRIDGARRHAEELAPAIDYLRRETGVRLDQLACIAVGTGPGLYTGLRVGVTTARTLAQVLDVPVVGIPSLDLVAYPWRTTHRRVVAVIDARRKEVFAARYWPVPGGLQRDGDYTVEPPETIAAELVADAGESLLVGDGALAYRDAFAGLDRVELAGPAAAAPSVAALVELATARFEREEFCRADEVTPLYLRRSDAEIAWDGRGAAAG
jgi:tRNA threonylcarbamoyladenosine biosynthesis protein TsaB